MKIEIFPDPDAVARKGAEIVAAEARAAVQQRGRFMLAVSGGHTPWAMFACSRKRRCSLGAGKYGASGRTCRTGWRS